MTKNIILCFTAGISDLKFVSKDGKILELGKRLSGGKDRLSVREVHEALLELNSENIILLPFDDRPDEVIINGENDNIFFHKINGKEKSIKEWQPVGKSGEEYKLLQHGGKLVMMADKFTSLWNKIQEQADSPDIHAVLGFRTMRDSSSRFYASEPVAAERLIFDRLVNFVQAGCSELVTYLEGSEENFGREAKQRIESKLRNCRKAIRKNGLKKAVIEPWLAITGGMPDTKVFLRAAAELQFGKTRSFQQREGGTGVSFQRAPQDSLVARRHALDLVRRGALIEAAAFAMPYAQDKDEQYWVYPLQGLARFLFDNPVYDFACGRYPNGIVVGNNVEPPQFLIEFAKQIRNRNNRTNNDRPRRSLLVGMRVEAALRSQKWLEAISLAFTFHEVAIKDIMERVLNGRIEGRYLSLAGPLDKTSQTALCEERYGNEFRSPSPCLQETRHSTYKIQSDAVHNDPMCNFLEKGLPALHTAIANARDFRNRITHDLLKPDDVSLAMQALGRGSLFVQSSNGENNITSFLDSQIVKDVFSKGIGFGGGNILDELIREMEKILLGDGQ